MDYLKIFKKHKILFSVIAAVTVLVTAGCAVASHYLGKIHFDDGKPSAAPSAYVTDEGSTASPLASDNLVNPEKIDPAEEGDIGDFELDSELSSQLGNADRDILANLSDQRIWHSEDVLNILLAGIDYGNKNFPLGRSDAMILISVNKVTQTLNLVSLSRAAYVSIQGYNNTRLSHAHGYGGAALMLDTIEKNYKIDIDNYVSVGFDAFRKVIDILGGCTIELTGAEASALKSKIKENGLPYNGAGPYRLNGNLALEYVRLRKIDTDRERTGRQRKIILSLIETAKSTKPMTLYNLMNKVLPYVTTDMTKSQLITLGYTALTDYKDWPIKQTVIPNSPTPLTLVGSFEVLKLNWQEELKYLHEVLYKDVPDERISYVA